MMMLKWCCFGLWSNAQRRASGLMSLLLRCQGESDLRMQGDVILGAESQVFCILVEEDFGACFFCRGGKERVTCGCKGM